MDIQHGRSHPAQRDEYQPTTYIQQVWRPPIWLRLGGVVMGCALAAVLMAQAVGEWLPDAHVFAYERTLHGGDSLYLYETGTHVRVQVHQAANIRGVKWTPDGAGLILSDDAHSDWYAVGLDGVRRTLREDEILGTSYLPAPDWSRYIHVRGESVLLYDAAQDRAGLVPLLAGVQTREVVWSPDSEKIAVSIGAGNGEARFVGIINITERTWSVITTEPSLYARLQWSPDSHALAFIDLPDTIHIHNIETTRTDILSPPGQLAVSAVAWSPDSQQIAYGVRGGPLTLHPLDGSPPRVLVEHLSDDSRLAWSPDGPWLLVRSGNLVEHTVTLVHVERGMQRQMLFPVSSQGFMAWQP